MNFFAQHFYRARGITLRYYIGGKGSPLLFLHGGGVQAMTYRRNLLLLTKRFRVVAPDLPCFGGSSVPEIPWSFSDYASFFDAFLKEQNLSRVTALGHSFGGGVALSLAARTHAVTRLILIDSAGLPSPYSRMIFFYKFLVQKSISNLKTYGNQYTHLLIAKDFLRNVLAKASRQHHILATTQHSLAEPFIQFPKITVPTLIVWGDRDELFPVSIAYQFHQRIPHAQLEIIAAKHDWPLFQPERFFSIIRHWIDSGGYQKNTHPPSPQI